MAEPPIWNIQETVASLNKLADMVPVFNMDAYLECTNVPFCRRSLVTRQLDRQIRTCFARFSRTCLAAGLGVMSPDEATIVIRQTGDMLATALEAWISTKTENSKRYPMVRSYMDLVDAAASDILLALGILAPLVKYVDTPFHQNAVRIRVIHTLRDSYPNQFNERAYTAYTHARQRYQTIASKHPLFQVFAENSIARLTTERGRLEDATNAYTTYGIRCSLWDLVFGFEEPNGDRIAAQYKNSAQPRAYLPRSQGTTRGHMVYLSTVFSHTPWTAPMTRFELETFWHYMHVRAHCPAITRMVADENPNVPLDMLGIHYYTAFGHKLTNSLLRGEALSERFWPHAGQAATPQEKRMLLDDTLFLILATAHGLANLSPYRRNDQRLPYVFRGCHYSPDLLRRYARGACVTEKAFTSTSKSLSRRFESPFPELTITYVIHSATGRDVSPYSISPREKKVCFPPFTRFLVTGVYEADPLRQRGGPYAYLEGDVITMEEISEEPAS